MNNIKIFDQDLPNDIDLSNEKVIGLDCEALGLVLGRDPLTLVQLGLESKKYFLIKLDRNNYNAPNLKKLLNNKKTQFIMHYARQDLLWLKYHLGIQIDNLVFFIYVINYTITNDLREEVMHKHLVEVGPFLFNRNIYQARNPECVTHKKKPSFCFF